MKQTIKLIGLSIIVSLSTLAIYHASQENSTQQTDNYPWRNQTQTAVNYPVNHLNGIENNNFTTAAKQSLNAVVHVKNVSITRTRSFFGYGFGNQAEERKYIRGAGSGVIISPDGYIVTNNHVIEGASEVDVTLNNNETFTAEVIGTAPNADIALLKINRENLNYMRFGDSDAVEVGEWVLAIGNPFNLTSTVTAGIISAKARDLNPEDNIYQSFIQTDAAVNPGNSGGALVNTKGELIGINTAITSKTGAYIGYSFAVPSNNAKKIIDDLIEFGSIKQAVLGVTGVDINETNYKQLQTEVTQGYYISGFTEESPAKTSGLQEEDIITKIDGIKIRKFADLRGYLSSKNPGDVVNVTYLRSGDEHQIKVRLNTVTTYLIRKLGLQVSNLDEKDYKTYGVDYGVKITKSASSDFKLFEDQLILSINGENVSNINNVKQLIESNGSRRLIITFRSKDGQEKTYVIN